jgi:hypothetical protein
MACGLDVEGRLEISAVIQPKRDDVFQVEGSCMNKGERTELLAMDGIEQWE